MAAVTMSMAAVQPALLSGNKSAFKGTRVVAVAPKKVAAGRATLQVRRVTYIQLAQSIARGGTNELDLCDRQNVAGVYRGCIAAVGVLKSWVTLGRIASHGNTPEPDRLETTRTHRSRVQA